MVTKMMDEVCYKRWVDESIVKFVGELGAS